MSVHRKWLGLSHSPHSDMSCIFWGSCPLPICILTTSAPLSWLIIVLARAPTNRLLYHGVSRPDLPIQPRIFWCTGHATRSISHSSTAPPRLASSCTDVSWTHALCNDDPSPLLASSWSTSSTTTDFIVLNTPNLDPDHTIFPTYTTDLFTATS